MSHSEGTQEQVPTQLCFGEEDRLAITQEVANIFRKPTDTTMQGPSYGNATSV